MKRMEGMKKVLSLLMCVIMVFGMLPANTFAVTTDENGAAVYETGDTVWVQGENGEPTGLAAAGTFWLPVYDENDQPVTKQGLCEKTEHIHAFVCAEDCQLAHDHDDSCYTQAYTGCVIHTHDESCTSETVYDCGKEVHETHDSCTSSQVCAMEAHDHAAENCSTEVRYTCNIMSHDHAECQLDENGNFTCGKEQHNHSVEAGCAYETVFACGKENHAHAEGSCTLTTVYDCGKELHTHESCTTSVRYVGCVEHTVHDENCVTEQRLTCGKEAHTCVTEGCAQDCAIEEHTHTAACDMESVYYQWIVVEDTSDTFDASSMVITVPASGKYTLYDSETGFSQTVDAVSSGSWGNRTYTVTFTNVPNGEYAIASGKVGGGGGKGSAYAGTVTVTDTGFTTTMSGSTRTTSFNSLTDEQKYAMATCVWYNTNSFNHLHLKAAGSYVIEIGGQSYTATISNPTFIVTMDGKEVLNVSEEGTTSYEWTYNGTTRRTSEIIVTLTVDLTYKDSNGKTHVMEDVTVTYNNQQDLYPFIMAIVNCDAVQGLDFTVTVEDIQEALKYYNVVYQWRVYHLDGTVTTDLPASLGAHGLPASETGLQENSDYTYNTGYQQGTSYYDYENGLLYTFSGWTNYSHSDTYADEPNGTSHLAMDTDGTITITADTWINGHWIVTKLEPSDAYLMVKKVIDAGDDQEYVENYLDNVSKLFVRIDPHIDQDGDDASQVDVDYDALVDADGYRIDVYQYDTPFDFTEKQADVPGYTRTTEVTVSGTNLSLPDGAVKVTGDSAAVTIDPHYESVLAYNLGTVTYTNTYTKKTGEAVQVYPQLTLWKTDSSAVSLPNVTFTLYSDEACTQVVGTYTTGSATGRVGYVDIPFTQAGTYYLKETTTPDGYIQSNAVYKIEVSAKETVEELRNDAYVQVTYYTLTVTIPEGDNASFSTVASQSLETSSDLYTLQVRNEPIKADLKITKTFYNTEELQSFVPTSGSIMVDIYGPVVYTGSDVTDVGPLVYNDLIIDSTDNWTLTVDDLPYGEYFLEETLASVHGYTWTGATFNGGERVKVGDHYGTIIKVENTSDLTLNIQNQYAEWEAADFFVQKTDEKQSNLAGAKFQLFDGTTNVTEQYLDTYYGTYDTVTASAVTNSNGVIHFASFELSENETSKTFILKEFTAPNGYYLNTHVYTVTVTLTNGVYDITVDSGSWDQADDLLTVLNTPILGQIKVDKEFKGDEVPEGTYITFALTNADGSVSRTANVTEKDDWTHTFSGLPLGTYTVSETYASVDGYTYTTTYSVNSAAAVNGTSASVTLTDNSDGTLTEGIPTGADARVVFTNVYDRQEQLTVVPDSFTVIKRGEDGEALEGAVFTLFADQACKTQLTDVPFATQATTNNFGIAYFTGLKLADLEYDAYKNATGRKAVYYMKETTAPANHVPFDTVWKITLDEGIKVEKLNDKNVFETVVDWIAGIFTPKGEGVYEGPVSDNTLAVTNTRIKGDLSITKTVSEGVDTSNARFEIHVHGPITRGADNSITDIGPLVKTIELTNGTLTASLADLELGEYVIRETFASIHGYTWNGVTYAVDGEKVETVDYENKQFAVFTVDKDTPDVSISLSNAYTVWEAADFTIHKVKADTTTGLAGAVFALYDNENCTGDPVATQTTGIAGYATFSGFTVAAGETKTYYLKEVTAPDNYAVRNTVWKVTISHTDAGYGILIEYYSGDKEPGSNWVAERDALWVENTEILGSITISKEITGSTPDDLTAITVKVIGDNGYSNEVTLSAPEWKTTVPNLPMGKYAVVEKDGNVAGYTLTTTYYENGVLEGTDTNPATSAEVMLDEGANRVAPEVAVKIRNNYDKRVKVVTIPVSFTIQKLDGEDMTTPLKDAKFILRDEEGNQVGDPLVTGEDGKVTVSNLELTELQYNQYLELKEERSVKYYLSESDAPAGYKSTDMVWEITLTEDQVQIEEVDPDDNFFTAIYQWILSIIKNKGTDSKSETTLGEDNVLTVYNDPIKGSMNFTKEYSFKNANGDAIDAPNLNGTSIIIHAHGPITWDNGVVTDMGEERVLTLENGALTGSLSNLPLGDYLVHETFASIHGFDWATGGKFNSTETVTVEHDGVSYNYYLYHVTENPTESSDPVAISITNEYTEWTAADFWIYKTNQRVSGNALEGAEFQVYTNAACTDEYKLAATDGGPTAFAKTGTDGLAHFENFAVPEGKTSITYYVKEVKAPSGYYLNDAVWTVQVEIQDGKYQLTITGGDNGSIDAMTDRITVVNELILGDLTITKDFTGDTLVDAENNPITNLSINVTVTGPNNYEERVTLKKDETTGKLTAKLENLPLGTYTVTEDTALAKVAGYDLISTTYNMDGQEGMNSVEFVDTDYSAAMTITNEYDKKEAVINNPDQFTIIKTDDAGKSLPGAEFTLTNDHNPADVRVFTTGADGKVVIDGLIGNGTITGQTSRTYTLEETKAPVGHELAETRMWEIEVKVNGEGEIDVQLNTENNTFETIWNWIIGKFEPEYDKDMGTLTVVNPRKTAQVSVTKTVEYAGLTDAENNEFVKESLKDAEYTFELYVDGSKKETITVVRDEKTGNYETKTFETKIPYGSTYEVKEVCSDEDAFTYELSSNATGTVDADALNGINVEAENTYTFQSGDPLTLNMVKVSSGLRRKPLSGAQFVLYDSDSSIMGFYKSDMNGQFQISEIEAPGTYTVKEIVAPKGYYKLDKPITITAEYEYVVTKNADGESVIVKSLVAKVSGRGVYEISEDTYGIKNTRITSNPKTGDDMNLMLWGGLAMTSLLCMVMMIMFFPRKKGKYQR